MTATNLTILTFPDASTMPRLRLRTWRMGELSGARRHEIRARQHGIATGISLIETAEIDGDGAEEVAGVALLERRG